MIDERLRLAAAAEHADHATQERAARQRRVADFLHHVALDAAGATHVLVDRHVTRNLFAFPQAAWALRYSSTNISRSLPHQIWSSAIMIGTPYTPRACAATRDAS